MISLPEVPVVVSVFSALAATAAWLAFWRARAAQARQARQIAALRSDLRALTSAAVGVGERVIQVERRQRRLAERQDQHELYEAASPPYEQAIRMVHSGADIDQIMEVCGLSRGEAELIAMLHRLDRAS